MNGLQTTALTMTAMAAIAGCYGVSLKAATERAAVATGRAAIARDLADMRILRAELRTRSRLPELQRWNEQVLALAAPRAEQLVASPVLLAAYAAQPAPAAVPAPVATVAVVRDAPAPEPVLRKVNFAGRAVRDLGTDAALAGGVAAAVRVSFTKVALR